MPYGSVMGVIIVVLFYMSDLLHWGHTETIRNNTQEIVIGRDDFDDANYVPPNRIIPLPEVTHLIPKEECISEKVQRCEWIRGTKSPCARTCIKPRVAHIGDSCDPQLWRFARRKYDDAIKANKQWMPNIIATNFLTINADDSYKGECKYICPAQLCMSVVQDTSNITIQYIDMVTYDCVQPDLDKNFGVCTCGYLWSLVDPNNHHRTLNLSSELVSFKATVGLNRRLTWDAKNRRCSSIRYGHCSLGWGAVATELQTFCLDPNHKCVNRSASLDGVAYRPLRSKLTGMWYGICDSDVEITDPFANKGQQPQNCIALIMAAMIVTPIVSKFASLQPQ